MSSTEPRPKMGRRPRTATGERWRGRLLCSDCGNRCPCWIMQKALTNADARQCTRCCACFAPATLPSCRLVQPDDPEADPAGVWWDRRIIGRTSRPPELD